MNTSTLNKFKVILTKTFFLICIFTNATFAFDPDIFVTTGPTTGGPVSNRVPDGGRWIKVGCGQNIGNATAKLSPDGKTLIFGGAHVDEGFRGQGIGRGLYDPIFGGGFSDTATRVTTIWVEDNEKAYRDALARGLDPLDAARETPSAHLWGKDGWDIDSVTDDNGILRVKYSRKPIIPCSCVPVYCLVGGIVGGQIASELGESVGLDERESNIAGGIGGEIVAGVVGGFSILGLGLGAAGITLADAAYRNRIYCVPQNAFSHIEGIGSNVPPDANLLELMRQEREKLNRRWNEGPNWE